MTEQTFPFQDGAPALEGLADAEESGKRRTVVALGVAGAVAVAALGGYFFVFAGGDDATPAASPRTPRSSSPVVPAPAVTPKPATVPKISQKSFGKDPFKALLADRTGGAGAGAGVTPVGITA